MLAGGRVDDISTRHMSTIKANLGGERCAVPNPTCDPDSRQQHHGSLDADDPGFVDFYVSI